MSVRSTPSFVGLRSASRAASNAHRGSSRKKGTKPELALRRALRSSGLRYRVDFAELPGRPDLAFTKTKVAIFVDGDFWHGRNLEQRLAKLESGHNAPYWVAKIKANVARDERHNLSLREAGWLVLRFWASDVERDADGIAERIRLAVADRISANSRLPVRISL